MSSGKIVVSGIGGVAASFGSMLCCTGPALMASIGVSGAGLSVMRPYRPVFLVVAGVSLYLAYWMLEREDRRACDPGEPCADPRTRTRVRRTLSFLTAVAVLFASSPLWAEWVFG